MARLLNWPVGLGFVSMSRLAGPRVRGEATESIGGAVQTTASVFGVQEWQFEMPAMQGQAARAWRGLVTALHGGANAVRVPFWDLDRRLPIEAGTTTTGDYAVVPWSNDEPFSNGQGWRSDYPSVTVAAAAAKDTSIIQLTGGFWSQTLGMGERIGFGPLHFGVYEVTEVISPGTYRVWPILRKALSVGDLATLKPVMAMRLKGLNAANDFRGLDAATGLSITLVEVPDDVVRRAFTS